MPMPSLCSLLLALCLLCTCCYSIDMDFITGGLAGQCDLIETEGTILVDTQGHSTQDVGQSYTVTYRVYSNAAQQEEEEEGEASVIVVSDGPALSTSPLLPLKYLACHSNFRVIFYDQVGTGGSTKPEDFSAVASPTYYSNELGSIVRALRGQYPVHLIAQGLGVATVATFMDSLTVEGETEVEGEGPEDLVGRIVLLNPYASYNEMATAVRDFVLADKSFTESYLNRIIDMEEYFTPEEYNTIDSEVFYQFNSTFTHKLASLPVEMTDQHDGSNLTLRLAFAGYNIDTTTTQPIFQQLPPYILAQDDSFLSNINATDYLTSIPNGVLVVHCGNSYVDKVLSSSINDSLEAGVIHDSDFTESTYNVQLELPSVLVEDIQSYLTAVFWGPTDIGWLGWTGAVIGSLAFGGLLSALIFLLINDMFRCKGKKKKNNKEQTASIDN